MVVGGKREVGIDRISGGMDRTKNKSELHYRSERKQVFTSSNKLLLASKSNHHEMSIIFQVLDSKHL